MSIFIDTDKITDNDELLETIKKNITTARNIRKEIKELNNINLIQEESNDEKIFFEQKDNVDSNNDDFEYEYYYELIKGMPSNTNLEQMKAIIKDSLPSKNNSNYFKIINRIKAEIFKEIIELYNMFQEADDQELKDDIKNSINFEKQKLSVVKEENIKELEEELIEENNIVFLKTNSGNIYTLDDIKSIDNEYYESFLELFESIKNGTFKNIRRLTTTNTKVSSISEVKGFKTRIIFDKIGHNTYVILQVSVKKSDFDRGYKESLQNRISVYRTKKEEMMKKLSDDDYMSENKEIELRLIEILSQNKKKVMMINE